MNRRRVFADAMYKQAIISPTRRLESPRLFALRASRLVRRFVAVFGDALVRRLYIFVCKDGGVSIAAGF